MLEKIHRLSIPDTMTNVCNGGIDCSSSITKARGEDQKEFESHSIKHKLSEVNNIHQLIICKNNFNAKRLAFFLCVNYLADQFFFL